tara:strand:- start:160 stop:423 length:264 start_codon:yes stop_codon:yes gene_type:complete
MSRYYCPYCSSQCQFHKTQRDGVLVCGLCGDLLVKKSFFNARGIIGLVVAAAFLTPLLLMIIFIVADFTNHKMHKDSQSAVIVFSGI